MAKSSRSPAQTNKKKTDKSRAPISSDHVSSDDFLFSLDSVLGAIPDPIAILRADGSIYSANESFEKIANVLMTEIEQNMNAIHQVLGSGRLASVKTSQGSCQISRITKDQNAIGVLVRVQKQPESSDNSATG
jgi:hypothetical protein